LQPERAPGGGRSAWRDAASARDMKRLIIFATLALLTGCTSIGSKTIHWPLWSFDPHDTKYWDTALDRHWQQYGYPESSEFTVPIKVPWPKKHDP